VARYDKYEPYANGFRALLKNDFTTDANLKKVIGVGLDSAGLVVLGGGQTGVIGVLVLTSKRKAGAVVDIMTSGEIVDFGGTPGTKYLAAAADGAVSTTAGGVAVGFTAEGSRLIVRLGGMS